MWFLFNIEKGAWNFLMKIFWTVFSAHIIPTLCTWWMHSRESASCPEFDDQQQHFLLFLSFFLSFRPNMFSESCPDLAVSKSSGLLPIFARGKQLENIVRSGRLCHFVTSTKKEISWLRRVESVHDMMLTDWALAIGSISCLDANVRHLQRSASSSPHVLCAKVDFFQLFHEWERERERERGGGGGESFDSKIVHAILVDDVSSSRSVRFLPTSALATWFSATTIELVTAALATWFSTSTSPAAGCNSTSAQASCSSSQRSYQAYYYYCPWPSSSRHVKSEKLWSPVQLPV